MSHSPTTPTSIAPRAYFDAFDQLAAKIREGQSFSGRERNGAFLGSSSGRFADVSYVSGFDLDDDARALCLTDWDADGDLDLWLSNRTAPRVRFLRNDIVPPSKAWMAFLLEGDPGKSCPRDAIGARVTIESPSGKLTRMLAAGDGFLSQSSKWLHFGLAAKEKKSPESQSIERLTVRWPGGDIEEFDPPKVGGFYRLVQGRGKAEAVTVPRSAPLEAGPPDLPAPVESARIRFSQPLTVPPLEFTDLDGSAVALSGLWASKPILVNLWAGWCEPCREELRAFGEIGDAVTVLALNVENLSVPDSATPASVRAFLKELGWSPRAGFASNEIVAVFETLIRQSIYRVPRLPIPVSFLIDKGGWLSVVYKGPVTAAQVRADVAILDKGPAMARHEAVPFAGKWAHDILVTHPIAVAQAFLEGGYFDEARGYLKSQIDALPAEPAEERQRLQRADLLYWLGRTEHMDGHIEAARTSFEAAIGVNQNHAQARLELAGALAELGSTDQALSMLDAMGRSHPQDPNVGNALGDLHRKLGNRRMAIEHYATVVRRDAKFIPAVNALAWLRATAIENDLRNAAEALRLAEHLMTAPGAAQSPEFIATLAAAQAESGRFDEAVASTDRVIALARRRNDATLVQKHSERREHYAARQAWRDGGP